MNTLIAAYIVLADRTELHVASDGVISRYPDSRRFVGLATSPLSPAVVSLDAIFDEFVVTDRFQFAGDKAWYVRLSDGATLLSPVDFTVGVIDD